MTGKREKPPVTLTYEDGTSRDAKTSKPIKQTKEEITANQIAIAMLKNPDDPTGYLVDINKEGEVTSADKF